MLTRRRVLVGTLAAVSMPGGAQAQPGPLRRVGFLRNGPPPPTFIDGLRRGLVELGYIEGRNLTIEFALPDRADELPDAAADLVRRRVDVLLASGTPPVPAASRATRTIPIVFVASIDPVAAGVAASLAHPGGNVTGFTGTHADLMAKRLELLQATRPGIARVVILGQAANPGNARYVREAQRAADAAGVTVHYSAVRDRREFEQALAAPHGATALIQLDDVLFTSHRKEIVELAVKHRLPAMYGFREFVDAGGLMSYGPHWPDLYRRAAGYIDRILKGARAGDLPIEQPTKFELVVNLKTARTLGLTIPQSVLLRADQVIE